MTPRMLSYISADQVCRDGPTYLAEDGPRLVFREPLMLDRLKQVVTRSSCHVWPLRRGVRAPSTPVRRWRPAED